MFVWGFGVLFLPCVCVCVGVGGVVLCWCVCVCVRDLLICLPRATPLQVRKLVLCSGKVGLTPSPENLLPPSGITPPLMTRHYFLERRL